MPDEVDSQFGNAAEVQQHLANVEDGHIGVLHVARFASLEQPQEHGDDGRPHVLEGRLDHIAGGPEDHLEGGTDHADLIVVVGHGKDEGEGVGRTVLQLGIVLGLVPVVEFGARVGDGCYSAFVAYCFVEFCTRACMKTFEGGRVSKINK